MAASKSSATMEVEEEEKGGHFTGSSSILEYIAGLEVKHRLYQDVFTCVSVFRSLPSLAKNIVMRLLWLEKSIPEDILTRWVSKSGKKELLEAFQRLRNLKIIEDDARGAKIAKNFRDSLRKYVLNATPDMGVGDVSVDKRAPEAETVSAHARRSWERILSLLIDDEMYDSGMYQNDKDTESIRQVLISAGLLVGDSKGNVVSISAKGFQFLFLPHRQQVWAFLLAYVRHISHHQREKLKEDEVLCFLFKLSHLSLGQGYPIKSLSENERRVLMHLKFFGFVFQRKDTSKRYYPTELSLSLSASEIALVDVLGQTHGKLVVETTFRLVAYTKSKFQISILNKFARLDYRLPNAVIGVITRGSIMQALRNGITAQGITMYLEQYAHPIMKRNPKTGRAVPPTVTHQIFLWEKERKRFTIRKSFLISDFKNDEEFKTVLKFARDNKIVQWYSEKNKRSQFITVTEEGNRMIQEWRMSQRRR